MIKRRIKKIALSICFFFTVFTCTFQSVAIADEPVIAPKVSTLKKGDTAPFDGTLFSTDAAASLLVDLENRQKQCDIQKSRELSLLRSELQLKIDLKQSAFDALQYKHTNILSIKEDQIKFLQGQLKPTPWYESGEFWFAMGIVGGILITVGAGYAIGQASK